MRFLLRPAVFIAILIALAGVYFGLASTNSGYYHPDEFESYIEPAFQEIFPNFVNRTELAEVVQYRSIYIQKWHLFLMKAYLQIFQEYSGRELLRLMKIALIFLLVPMFYSIYKLAMLYLPPASARASLLAGAGWYYIVYFSHHLLSENYSLPLIAPALYCLCRADKDQRMQGSARAVRLSIGAGLLLALASQLRLQSALFCVGSAIYLGFKKRGAELISFCCSFFLMFLFGGLADLILKGRMFATLRAYYDINIARGLMTVVARPWYDFFTGYSIQFTEWFFPLFLILVAFGARRSPVLALPVIGFIAAQVVFPHKEIRFIYPATPFLIILACFGLDSLLGTIQDRRLVATIRGVTIVSLLAAQGFKLTHMDWRGGKSAQSCQLLESAGRIQGITKIHMIDYGQSCGYFSLGVDLPIDRVMEFEKNEIAFSRSSAVIFHHRNGERLKDMVIRSSLSLRPVQSSEFMNLAVIE